MDLQSIFSPWLIWFLFGIGFAFLELPLPGFIVFFFGIGCLVVAGILLIWNITVTQQILIFSVATILSIVILRKLLVRIFHGYSHDQANEGLDDFPKGMHVKVLRTITPNCYGRIKYRGSDWDATADEEILEGEIVEIVRYADDSHLVFLVKKISKPEGV